MSTYSEKLGIDPVTIASVLYTAGKAGYSYYENKIAEEQAKNRLADLPAIAAVAARYNAQSTPASSADGTDVAGNVSTYIAIGAAALISLIALTH
jgi:hypothetical protein